MQLCCITLCCSYAALPFLTGCHIHAYSLFTNYRYFLTVCMDKFSHDYTRYPDRESPGIPGNPCQSSLIANGDFQHDVSPVFS